MHDEEYGIFLFFRLLVTGAEISEVWFLYNFL